jgi:hypothetical protein
VLDNSAAAPYALDKVSPSFHMHFQILPDFETFSNALQEDAKKLWDLSEKLVGQKF